MRTVLLVPFRENLGPPLHRKVEDIADDGVTRWAWWSVLIILSQQSIDND